RHGRNTHPSVLPDHTPLHPATVLTTPRLRNQHCLPLLPSFAASSTPLCADSEVQAQQSRWGFDCSVSTVITRPPAMSPSSWVCNMRRTWRSRWSLFVLIWILVFFIQSSCTETTSGTGSRPARAARLGSATWTEIGDAS